MTEQGKAPAAGKCRSIASVYCDQDVKCQICRDYDALIGALEAARDVVRTAEVEGADHGDRCRGLAQMKRDAAKCMDTIRAALRLVHLGASQSEPAEGRPSPEIPAIPDSKG